MKRSHPYINASATKDSSEKYYYKVLFLAGTLIPISVKDASNCAQLIWVGSLECKVELVVLLNIHCVSDSTKMDTLRLFIDKP
jgi:hypothetical protein